MLKILRNIFSTNGIKYIAYQQPNRYALRALNKVEQVHKIESSTGNKLLDSIASSMGLKLDLSGDKAKQAQELIEAFSSKKKGSTLHFD